jgi:hypothetical protein
MADKISILPDDTVLSVEMNGQFYRRLQGVLEHIIAGMDMEDVMKIYQAAIEDKITNPTEFHVQTMLYLCKAVEDVCTEKNLWEEVDPDSIKGDAETLPKTD